MYKKVKSLRLLPEKKEQPAQPGLVEGVSAHGKGVGIRWLLRSIPTETILWFCDFTASIKL